MLRAENIHKVYRDGMQELHVLNGINLDIRRNEVICIVGPSGAGKSTLLHILGGIDRPTSGSVYLDNTDLYSLDDVKRANVRHKKIGFVFQFYHLLPEFSAIENVMLPALIARQGLSKLKDIRDRAEYLMEMVGLKDRMLHRPSALSGGEQQRVAIARALMNRPRLLLCDEPTGNLDSKMGEEVLRILFELNKKNELTLVIVTHDKDIAKKAQRIVEIKDGRIVSKN